MRKSLESWDCSAWRREGCTETLEQLSSTYRGPTEKTGTGFLAGPVGIEQGAMVSN